MITTNPKTGVKWLSTCCFSSASQNQKSGPTTSIWKKSGPAKCSKVALSKTGSRQPGPCPFRHPEWPLMPLWCFDFSKATPPKQNGSILIFWFFRKHIYKGQLRKKQVLASNNLLLSYICIMAEFLDLWTAQDLGGTQCAAPNARSRCCIMCMKIYWCYIPETSLSPVLGVQPSKTRSFPIKSGVIWVPGTYTVHIVLSITVTCIPPCGLSSQWSRFDPS